MSGLSASASSIHPSILMLCAYWQALRILGFPDERINWTIDVDLRDITVFDLADRPNPHDVDKEGFPICLVLAITGRGGFYIPCGRTTSREQAEADIETFFSLDTDEKRRIVQTAIDPKEIVLLGKHIAQHTDVPLFAKFAVDAPKIN